MSANWSFGLRRTRFSSSSSDSSPELTMRAIMKWFAPSIFDTFSMT